MTKQGLIALKLKQAKERLEARKAEMTDILSRKQEAIDLVTEESMEEEVRTAEEQLAPIEAEEVVKATEVDAVEKEIEDLERELEEVQGELKPEGDEEMPKNKLNTDQIEQRDAINSYVRKKEIRAVAGITATDAALVIPEEIIYTAEDEIGEVPSLRHLVTVQPVKRASGSRPIRAHASGRLNSVAELEVNPLLAKPAFTEVPWSVETYRGAIPISQEAIDDAEDDLTALVAKDAKEQKLNTENFLITEVLKTFTPKTVVSVDELKTIINVDLPSAYRRMFVCSASAFNMLDQLKDATGAYLLQNDLTAPTGKALLGMPIEKFDDTMFGLAGDKVAFVGDTKRAVLLSDRKQLEIKWTDHEIYGEYLRAGVRMGASVMDANAGFFVTLNIPVTTPVINTKEVV